MRQHHTKVHDDPLPNRTCADCGVEFYDEKARRTYCEDCDAEAGEKNGNYANATERTRCAECGDSFEYYPFNKDGVYCPDCVEKADGVVPTEDSAVARIEVHCENCDATLECHPSRVESSSYGEFCDLDWYGEWVSGNVVGTSHQQWEGGQIQYGTAWWQVRRAAWERDGYECQLCGAGREQIGRRPDVHHIKPVRSFDDPSAAHHLENVVCLCRSCHRRVEDGDATGQFLKS